MAIRYNFGDSMRFYCMIETVGMSGRQWAGRGYRNNNRNKSPDRIKTNDHIIATRRGDVVRGDVVMATSSWKRRRHSDVKNCYNLPAERCYCYNAVG